MKESIHKVEDCSETREDSLLKLVASTIAELVLTKADEEWEMMKMKINEKDREMEEKAVFGEPLSPKKKSGETLLTR
jgi:hypothetical protein